MPVDVSCENCHRALRLRDELAGRRVKCPGCSTAITVPAAASAPTRPAASAPQAPAMDIRQPAGEDEKPRRPTRRPPEGQDEDEAPRRSAAVQDARPPARREEDERPARAARRGRREEEEEENERPGKEKKPAASSLPMVLGIGGAVVALLLIGLGVWWFFFTGATPVADKGGDNGGDKGGDKSGKVPDKPSDITALKEWVPGDAQVLLCVRPADFLQTAQVRRVLDEVKKQNGGADPFPPQFREVEAKLGVKLSDVERVTFVAPEFPQFGPGGVAKRPIFWYVVELNAPADQKKVRGAMVEPADIQIDGKKCITGFLPDDGLKVEARKKDYIHFVNDKFVVLGNGASMRKAISLLGKRAAGQMDDALALAAKSRHLVLGFAIPDVPGVAKRKQDLRQMVQGNKEMAKLLPLLDATFTANSLHLGEEELHLESSVKYAGEAQAAEARKAADKGRELLKSILILAPRPKEEAGAKAIDAARDFVEGIKTSQEGDKLVLTGKIEAGEKLMGVLLPAISKVREAAQRLTNTNNMKQMLLAMHTYHDVHKRLPGDILHPMTKKPLLSWRVAILPYIGGDALYKRFKLDEPWDGPTNRPLLAQMPKLYALPNTAGGAHTHYQLFTGPGTAFPTPGPGFGIARITDGLSNTVLLAEAQQAVEWTKPADIAVGAGFLKPRLRPSGTSFLFGLADGSVQQVPTRINEMELRAIISPNGGEVPPAILRGGQ